MGSAKAPFKSRTRLGHNATGLNLIPGHSALKAILPAASCQPRLQSHFHHPVKEIKCLLSIPKIPTAPQLTVCSSILKMKAGKCLSPCAYLSSLSESHKIRTLGTVKLPHFKPSWLTAELNSPLVSPSDPAAKFSRTQGQSSKYCTHTTCTKTLNFHEEQVPVL